MLVHENANCGTRSKKMLNSYSNPVQGAADCAALAEGAGFKAFSLGTNYVRGRCYGNSVTVSGEWSAQVKAWQAYR